MKTYAIETRRADDPDWHALKPSSAGVITDLEDVSCLAFPTRAEAQAFIDDHRPPGYEARIVEVEMVLLPHRGRYDA